MIWRRTEIADEVVYLHIVFVQFRPGVIPSDDLLFRVDLLEHDVHVVQVFVIEEPDFVIPAGKCVTNKLIILKSF